MSLRCSGKGSQQWHLALGCADVKSALLHTLRFKTGSYEISWSCALQFHAGWFIYSLETLTHHSDKSQSAWQCLTQQIPALCTPSQFCWPSFAGPALQEPRSCLHQPKGQCQTHFKSQLSEGIKRKAKRSGYKRYSGTDCEEWAEKEWWIRTWCNPEWRR